MTQEQLYKTSVQLPQNLYRTMETWPGISRSEAIRLSVERSNYFSCLNAEEVSGLASTYAPILGPALEDFDYDDYRVVARALPAIVEGYIRENHNLSVTWRYDVNNAELDPEKLLKELNELDAIGRIWVLDCTVAERHRHLGDNVEKNSSARPRRSTSKPSTRPATRIDRRKRTA